MFSFLNAVQVIPPASVDFLQQILARSDIHVPVLLKASYEKMGWLSLCGWVPGQKVPVSKAVATETLVCPSERARLKTILEEFCGEVRAGERTERVAFQMGNVSGYRE